MEAMLKVCARALSWAGPDGVEFDTDQCSAGVWSTPGDPGANFILFSWAFHTKKGLEVRE